MCDFIYLETVELLKNVSSLSLCPSFNYFYLNGGRNTSQKQRNMHFFWSFHKVRVVYDCVRVLIIFILMGGGIRVKSNATCTVRA